MIIANKRFSSRFCCISLIFIKARVIWVGTSSSYVWALIFWVSTMQSAALAKSWISENSYKANMDQTCKGNWAKIMHVSVRLHYCSKIQFYQVERLKFCLVILKYFKSSASFWIFFLFLKVSNKAIFTALYLSFAGGLSSTVLIYAASHYLKLLLHSQIFFVLSYGPWSQLCFNSVELYFWICYSKFWKFNCDSRNSCGLVLYIYYRSWRV